MGYLKNHSMNMGTSTAVTTTRTKLFGAQVGYRSEIITWDPKEIDRSGVTITLRDGSVTGDIKFKFSLPIPSGFYFAGVMPWPLSFNDCYILFNDGIYVVQMSSASEGTSPPTFNRDLVQLSLFYEI